MVHDLTLVIDQILNGQRGRKKLMASPKMIKFATLQRQDRHLQISQIIIRQRRMSTQSTAKSAIKIIFLELTRWRLRLLRQLPHGLITQQPYANIRQIIMIFQQTAQRFDRRSEEHTSELQSR